MIHSNLSLPADAIQDLCCRYQVKELSVFGSAIEGNFTSRSDVDFLVEFQPDARIGFMAFISLQQELAALIQREVDLVSVRGLNPLLQREVLEDRQIIYVA